MSFLYWIYDETCNVAAVDGYVGVTEDVNKRLKAHLRKTKNITGKLVKIKILHEGSRRECFDKEKELRPVPNIGWNNAVGGSHGWREGFCHSEETKEKMSTKWTDERKANLVQRNIEQGRTRKGLIQKQLYILDKCIHCSIEATSSNITKWHNKNCKMNLKNVDNEIGSFEYIECPYCSFRPNTTKANSRRNFKVYHLEKCKNAS